MIRSLCNNFTLLDRTSSPRGSVRVQELGLELGWRGGLVVGRRTCDLVVAGSRPGRDAAA